MPHTALYNSFIAPLFSMYGGFSKGYVLVLSYCSIILFVAYMYIYSVMCMYYVLVDNVKL